MNARLTRQLVLKCRINLIFDRAPKPARCFLKFLGKTYKPTLLEILLKVSLLALQTARIASDFLVHNIAAEISGASHQTGNQKRKR